MKTSKIKSIFMFVPLLVVFSLFFIACETEEEQESEHKLHQDLDDKSEEAFRDVFVDVTDLREMDDDEYEVISEDTSIGYASVVEVRGHVDKIRLLVSFDETGDTKEVNEVVIIEHGESPGLGARIEEEEFISQFEGTTEEDLALAKEGGEIDGITGSTQSTNAVIRGVKESLDAETSEGSKGHLDYPIDEKIDEIFPGFTNFEEVSDREYEVFDEDSKLGYAKVVEVQGHIDDIVLLVGFDETKTVEDFVILDQNETPGRFEKIEEEMDDFKKQFKGLSIEEIELVEEGGDIDAVTGATRTSEAIVEGLRKSLTTNNE
ncbi:MAG: FMN-binding protein [Candidatus Nanoarchaeia archaeon]